MNTKEILIGARDLIATHGLAQHAYQEGECHCAVGAIIKQIAPNARMGEGGEGPSYHRLVNTSRVVDAIQALGFNQCFLIYPWNDESTKEEVVKRFNGAIAMVDVE